MHEMAAHPDDQSMTLGRRQFVRRAVVAGAIVWTVPTIVSLEPAGASTTRHSARPVAPPRTPVERSVVVPAEPTGGGEAKQLPFTGDNEVVEAVVAAGLLAAGVAMVGNKLDPRPEV